MEKGIKYGLLAAAAGLGIYSIWKANQEEEEVAALPSAQTQPKIEYIATGPYSALSIDTIANPNYASQNQQIIIQIATNNIPYYHTGVWLICGYGEVDSVSIMRLTHGDMWNCRIADIVNDSYLNLTSINVENNIATITLTCTMSGNNKYQFYNLSPVSINSISVI